MKEKSINIPFAIASVVLSMIFSVGVFYATVENRLNQLENSQKGYSDVRERVIRIETKMDYLIHTTPETR